MIMTQNHFSEQEPRAFRPRGASLLEEEPSLADEIVDLSGGFNGFIGGGSGSPFDDDALSFSGSQFDSESEAPSTLLSSFDDVDFAAHNAFDAIENVPDDASSTVSGMESTEEMEMNSAAAVSSSLAAVSAVSVVDASIGSLVSDESMRISENRLELLDRIGASSYNTERSSSTHTRTFRSTPSKNTAAAAAAAASQLASRSGKFVGHYDPVQRAERIKRFHEKRLRRRWGKRIKYMDRKLQAENQKRVRGRFAKVDPALKAAAAAKLESPLH